jgi:PTH1 family peptidyl-tRNA hydrolase
MPALKLIVGLGNPGAEYLRTRHNAGFWLADALAARVQARFGHEIRLHGEIARVTLEGESPWLFKPATFMNRCGLAVAAALRYWKIDPSAMLVVHDDLDLPPGTVRLKFGGGHGGQNGLRDIIEHLGHADFHRLRIGIGHPGNKDRVTSWVLGRPGKDDEAAMLDAIGRALDEMPAIAAGRFDEVMKRLHTAGG